MAGYNENYTDYQKCDINHELYKLSKNKTSTNFNKSRTFQVTTKRNPNHHENHKLTETSNLC